MLTIKLGYVATIFICEPVAEKILFMEEILSKNLGAG